MPKRIIAVRGSGNVGKTTSLRYSYGELIRQGANQLPDLFEGHGHDFLDVLEWKGLRIGIWTGGDKAQALQTHLTTLDGYNCDVILCACHPGRASGSPGQTGQVILSFTAFIPTFVDKHPAMDNHQFASQLVSQI